MKLNVLISLLSVCLGNFIRHRRSVDFLQKVIGGSGELDEYDLMQLLSHVKQISEFGLLNGLF